MAKNEVKIGVGLDISKIQGQAQDIAKILDKIKLDPIQKKTFDTMLDKFGKDLKTYQEMFSKGFKTKADVNQFDKLGSNLIKQASEIQKQYNKIVNLPVVDLEKKIKLDGTVKKQVDDLNKSIKEALTTEYDNKRLSKLIADLDPSKFKSEGIKKKVEEVYNAFNSGKIDEAYQKLNKFYQQYQNIGADNWGEKTEGGRAFATFKGLSENLEKLNNIDPSFFTNFQSQIEGLNAEKLKLISDYIQDVVNSSSQLASEDLKKPMEDLATGAKSTAENIQQTSSEIEQLGNRVKYFFSLTNGVMLFRRAIRSAISTVKDLDKVMTETAVVTNFSVGDMWSQLPEYTERANALGVSIHDAYEAATLYYQQGLKTNQVMEVSNSTLKMARIAGLNAAEATDRMTNALRGFNMEINETNADRVADVYSKLAAISASNVDEISTAMTKVASLANNANMSFENTAAFLAQIVETTRESAETAGTALKTVVARFSEVKKLYSEGDLMGKDEEDNDIDVNKVSVALRSAGVDLNEYLTGMKGLDQIFIELASKWDSLDQVQQRYIATMAAGSRQQSRFIALMSDYQRTQELTTAATNASGASQAQFEKTLDSLQSKLAQLKNAWDTFLMGLANNEIIKFFVDRLKDLIGVLNTITSIMPGVLGSFNKLLVTFLGLKLGKDLFAGLKAGFTTLGKDSAATFGGEFKREFSKQSKGFRSMFRKAFWIGEKEIKKSATIPKETINSYKDFRQAINNLTIAEKSFKDISESTTADMNEKIAAQAHLTYAQKEQSRALESYIILSGVEEEVAKEQLATVNALLVAHEGEITEEQALAVAKAGVTSAQFEEIVAKNGSVSAALVSIGVIQGETLAEMKLTSSKEIANAIEKKGLIGKIAALGIRIANIEATEGEAAAQWTLNGAMMAGLGIVLALVAGVGALIGVIAIIYNAIKDNTLDARLEKTNKNLEAAQQAAEDAKQAYEDLSSALESIESNDKVFEELTKGTREWNDALIKANDEVLELINKYPQLAKYLTTGKYGQLTITEEGKEVELNNARNRVAGSSAAVAMALSKRDMVQRQQIIQQLNDRFNVYINDALDKDNSLGGYHVGTTARFNQQLQEMSDIMTKDGKNAIEVLEEFSPIWSQLFNTSDINEAAKALNEYNAQMRVQTAEIKNSTKAALMAGIDTKNIDYEYIDEITSGFSETLLANIDSSIREADIGADFQDNNLFKKIAAQYGVNSENLSKKDKKSLARVYSAQNEGVSYSDILEQLKNGDISEEEILNEIISRYETDDLTKSMNNLIEEMKKLPQSMQKSLVGMVNKTTNNMTRQDINALKNTDFTKLARFSGMDLVAFAEAAGYRATNYNELNEIQKNIATGRGYSSGMISAEDMMEIMREYLIQIFDDIQEEVNKSLVESGLNNAKYFTDTMTTEQQSKFQEQIEKISDRGGNVQEYTNLIKQLINSVAPEDVSKIWEQLLLGDVNDAQQLQSALDALCISINGASKIINDEYRDALRESIKATYNYSASMNKQARENYLAGKETAEALISDNRYTLSKKEKEKLIAAGVSGSQFVKTGAEGSETEFAYIGAQEDLLKAIRNRVDDIYKDGVGTGSSSDYDKQIAELNNKILENEEQIKQKQTNATVEFPTEASEFKKQYEISGLFGAKETNDVLSYINSITSFSDFLNVDRWDIDYDDTTGAQAFYQVRGILKKYLQSQVGEEGLYDLNRAISGETDNIDLTTLKNYLNKGKELLKFSLDFESNFNKSQLDAHNEILELEKQNKEYQAQIEQLRAQQEYNITGRIQQANSISDLLKIQEYVTSLDSEAYQEYITHLKQGEIPDGQGGWITNAQLIEEGYGTIDENGKFKFSEGKQADWAREVDTIYLADLREYNKEIENQMAGLVASIPNAKAQLDSLVNSYGQLTKGTQALAITEARIQNAMDNTGSTIKDQLEVLKTAKAGTVNYNSALTKLSNSLDTILDITDTQMSSGEIQKFVTNNLSLIEQWAEGNEEASKQVIKSYLKTLYSQNDLSEGAKKVAEGTFDNISNVGAALLLAYDQFDQMVEGEALDLDSSWKNAMEQLINDLELTIEQAENLFAQMNLEAVVEQTKDGLRIKGATKRSYFNAFTGFGGNSGSGGSSKGYEPDYDILYNLIADLEEIQKFEERLVEELDELKENPDTTSEQIISKLTELIYLYRKNYELENQKLQARQTQAREVMNDNADLQQYGWIDTKTGKVQINYDLIYSVTDENEGKRIDDYIKQLEEIGDDIVESQDQLDEIIDKVEDLKDYGRDSYLELEQRVMDSLVKLFQDQIDELNEINDSINDANQKIIDGINETLSKERQERENEKTEEEISNTAVKLAYLQMDTSGSNQVEILQLQKQLDDQRQSYTDSLIDQKINELEEQNKVAQEQRERQIQVAEKQLENAQETGKLWSDVHALMNDEKGKLSKNTQNAMQETGLTSLAEALKNSDGWLGKSEEQRRTWEGEFKTQFAQASVYKNGGVSSHISETLTELEKLTNNDDSNTNKWLQKINDKNWAVNITNVNSTPSYTPPPETKTITSYETTIGSTKFSANTESELLDKIKNYFMRKGYDEKSAKAMASAQKSSFQTKTRQVSAYATGGLADFTGPAWLDGTKTKPELVLNQRDTENFLQLREILAQVMAGQNTNIANPNLERTLDRLTEAETESEKTLGRIYDALHALRNAETNINVGVQVDHVNNEEDLADLINRIKEEIYGDAMYRNVNVLNQIY